MTVHVMSGSSRRLTSIRLARVGNIRAASTPVSSSSARRGSAERKASMAGIGLPAISRRVLPSVLCPEKYSAKAPGGATTSKVGLGMDSLMWLAMAIFVRPLTWTYLMKPSYSSGR